MPGERDPSLVLRSVQGETGILFWHLLSDADLWLRAPEERLFWPREDAALLVELCPEPIRPVVGVIARIWWTPAEATIDGVADACAAIWEWAERLDLLEVALQFAERAARLQPTRSDRSSTAGRFCRLRGEPQRGTMWFRRALRIAQARKDYVEIAVARLGLGNLESELGRFDVAEKHQSKACKAALRAGQRSLAGSAYHNLLLLKTYREQYDEAWIHAQAALAAYKRDHPRFPAVAHDVALLWSRMGYHSAALPVFERVLPTVCHPHERMIVLGNVARSAAACGERLRYERAAREMESVLAEGGSVPLSTRYTMAYAARNASDWERADRMIRICAVAAPDGHYQNLTAELAEAIAARLPGERDAIPSWDSEIFETACLFVRLPAERAS
jgi:tetratricopeptide (TPR) repeat protein